MSQDNESDAATPRVQNPEVLHLVMMPPHRGKTAGLTLAESALAQATVP